MTDPTPPPQPARPVRRRRRVLATTGLTASVAVLALAVQAGPVDEGTAGSAYGDSAVVDLDRSAPADDGEDGATE